MIEISIPIPYCIDAHTIQEGEISFDMKDSFSPGTLVYTSFDQCYITLERVTLHLVDLLAFAKAVKALSGSRTLESKVSVGGPTPVLEFDSISGLISVERIHKREIDVSTFLNYFMTRVYWVLKGEIKRGDQIHKNMKKLNEMFEGLVIR